MFNISTDTDTVPLVDVPPGREYLLLRLRSSTDWGKEQAGTLSSPGEKKAI